MCVVSRYGHETNPIPVDMADAKENRRFLLGFKKRLKVRFVQLDGWLTTYRVELL
jgi:hypothetical protein